MRTNMRVSKRSIHFSDEVQMSTTSEVKRLYKSRTERMIDGVCGGVAKYFNLDPTLVRIAWVVLTLMGGSGILLYIVAMIVMPKEPFVFPQAGQAEPGVDSASNDTTRSANAKKNSMFWGILLIVVGGVLFLNNLDIPLWHGWWWVDKGLVLSVLLILVGVAFMWGGRNSMTNAATPEGTLYAAKEPAAEPAQGNTNDRPKRIYRSFTDKKLFGVCGGLGEYFDIDSTIVRLLFVVAAIASSGLALVAYIICAIIFPRQLPAYTV